MKERIVFWFYKRIRTGELQFTRRKLIKQRTVLMNMPCLDPVSARTKLIILDRLNQDEYDLVEELHIWEASKNFDQMTSNITDAADAKTMEEAMELLKRWESRR